jgi:uncharacterized protein HemX
MLELFQTTPPAPENLVTLQWIIIVALASAVAFLYRQAQKRDDKYQEEIRDLINKTLLGFGENTEAIKEISNALEALRDNFSLRQEIEILRREISRDQD